MMELDLGICYTSGSLLDKPGLAGGGQDDAGEDLDT